MAQNDESGNVAIIDSLLLRECRHGIGNGCFGYVDLLIAVDAFYVIFDAHIIGVR